MTTQKIKIMEYLKSVKTHPTAEQVYCHVKKELPAISLATVYRNLNAMADSGEIIRFELNKEFHFDADTSCHQHFVCRHCSKVFDVCSSNVSVYAIRRFSKPGFEPDCVRIMYFGICRDCKGLNVNGDKNEKKGRTKSTTKIR